MAIRRILFLARAEVLHVVRDRATLAQVILIPIVQLLVLSNAATFKIENTPTYVVDLDHTVESRALVNRFAASGHFRVAGYSASPALANDALLRGRVTLALTIPHDFEQSVVRNRMAALQLSVNAEKGTAAGIVQFYASRIIAGYAAELSRQYPRVERQTGILPAMLRTGQIDVRVRNWYNPELDYKQYMVPGILVALVTVIGTLLTAQNIAREKELGTLDQLNVTPITRGQFIAAKMLPFWVLALLELTFGLLLGHFVFGVPVRGSPFLLLGVASIYLIAALGIGLWISTIVETQQQAMFVTFFIVIIYFLLSGLFTPVSSMPRWVQYLSQVNPVRHFVTISRAILIKGAGIREIAQPFAILIGYATAILFLAIRQYSKRTA